MTYYYNSECDNIHIMLGQQLNALLADDNACERDIVIMCIGSDRSTGDSLGPIVGYRLHSEKHRITEKGRCLSCANRLPSEEHRITDRNSSLSCATRLPSDSADKTAAQNSQRLNAFIYGDIHNPINATNLGCSLRFIRELHDNPYIIAIDACLGSPSHIGYVTLSTGPLRPGSGTENELPEVGNLHITGIVNTIHHGRHLLHSTRLSTVITLANVIEGGIRYTFTLSPYTSQ